MAKKQPGDRKFSAEIFFRFYISYNDGADRIRGFSPETGETPNALFFRHFP